MKVKRVLLLILTLVVLIGNSSAGKPREVPELKTVFDKYSVDGSILIYDQNANIYLGHNLERCNVAFCPASTFKIPNTLIALETGVATIETIFKWDGEKRSFSSWEKDMNIEEAFKLSCVPFYQEIARRVGVERMRYYIRLFNYGNMDINEDNIDKFWLEGNSAITQYQQIYFLRALYNLQLPINEQLMKQTKEIMLHEITDTYLISGKTGWAVRQNESVTWFVGYIEIDDNVFFFATNIAPNTHTDMKTFNQVRVELTKDILKELNIIH